MAYFIVIGTNSDVKCVVDEVKRAHLQHNIITSGCILSEDNGEYYHWDVFNGKGVKTTENKEPITLHDALTNQISQFKTLLPSDAIPNVFIISKCFNEAECSTLQMVCDELFQIGGATLSGLLVDIVIVGYDLNNPGNVTIRPNWQLLKSLRGLGEGGQFHTNILYINNMDYMGAATNVDSRVLSKFLCHWSKMVCAGGGYDPKATVLSKVYSIGISEYQYDFRDLNDFFKLSAEDLLLDRTLNNEPSSDTQELVDTNYFKKINLDFPWIDGLCLIQSTWRSYCSSEWNPSKLLSDNEYSVSQQELGIASYLNLFLKLYIAEESREIEINKTIISQSEAEKGLITARLKNLRELPDEDETKLTQIETTNSRMAELEAEIKNSKQRIQKAEENISSNEYIDAYSFYKVFSAKELITEEDEYTYSTNKAKIEDLIRYVKSEAGIGVMREAIKRATVKDILPEPFPASEVLNIGHVKAIEIPSATVPSLPHIPVDASTHGAKNKQSGCLFCLKGLFKKKKDENSDNTVATLTASSVYPEPINDEQIKFLNDKLDKAVAAIKKVEEVREWWNRLNEMIERNQKRRAECKVLMDGEKGCNEKYILGKEGYRPDFHRKSISLIDMDMVRNFRDNDPYYKQNIDRFLNRWFDKSIDPEKRMTMPELIKHQVLDSLVGKYHTLHWDGQSPFVKEEISDEDMHEIIEHNLNQSKPFVEYVRIQESNLTSNLNIGFFSNNPNITTDSNEFKKRYNVSSEYINPVLLGDFVNSLCVIQVMDIPEHVDALKDFKPRRDAELSKLRTNIKAESAIIVGDASTVESKAKAIYDWICNNIAYDTTKQIHDAETCYRTRRGVCQAYCELFCYMAEAVGLTADIIFGKTKRPDGKVSDGKHAWVFVYTNAYDGILIDPTWGAGVVNGTTFIRNEQSDIWFNISPYWMIFSHYPEQPDWTKLDIDVTENQFNQIPFKYPKGDIDGKDLFFESLSITLNI